MISITAVRNAEISKYFNVTPLIDIEPKFPYDGNGSPIYLGFKPIQLSRVVLSKISIPIVKIATEKTGSPTIGLKKVLSIKRLNIPVIETPSTNEIQNGNPLSTASELIIPAPTTAKAGCAKLRTSIDL